MRMASVMTSRLERCRLFSRNGLILLRIKGLYFATSPYRGHGSISAAGAIFKSKLLGGRDGRVDASCAPAGMSGTSCRLFLRSRKCEQNKNFGNRGYDSQPRVQKAKA